MTKALFFVLHNEARFRCGKMSPGCKCKSDSRDACCRNQLEFHTRRAPLDASTWKPPGILFPRPLPSWNEHVELWDTKRDTLVPGNLQTHYAPTLSRLMDMKGWRLAQIVIAASLSSDTCWKYLSVGGTGGYLWVFVGGVSCWRCHETDLSVGSYSSVSLVKL